MRPRQKRRVDATLFAATALMAIATAVTAVAGRPAEPPPTPAPPHPAGIPFDWATYIHMTTGLPQ